MGIYKRTGMTVILSLLLYNVWLPFGFFSQSNVLASPSFSGGTGTSTDPYIITSAAQLDAVRDDLTASYRLGADIDLSDYLSSTGAGYNDGAGWQPIGMLSGGFNGTFDGAGHVIKNLTINRPSSDYIGLFGMIGSPGTVTDVGLESVNIQGGNEYVGGLAGQNDGDVNHVHAAGTVKGARYVGGVVGYNVSKVESAYTSGSVIGSGSASDYVGGLIGDNEDVLSSSFSSSTVHGHIYIGGLTGYNNDLVSLSYFTGNVDGIFYVGGLTGVNEYDVLNNGFLGHTTSPYIYGVDDSLGMINYDNFSGSPSDFMQKSKWVENPLTPGVQWTFGSGEPWNMMNNTTLPMPESDFERVKLDSLAVTATGASATWDQSFASDQGTYAITMDHPVSSVEIAAGAVPGAGATVSMNGTEGATQTVSVHPGDNIVNIQVSRGDGGVVGVYQLTITVPKGLTGVEVPSDGIYGPGSTLEFIVDANIDLQVDGTPGLPIEIGNGSSAQTVKADYTGKVSGDSSKMVFHYTVAEGLEDTDGIQVGDALVMPSGAGLVDSGSAFSPNDFYVPDTSGVQIDSVNPTISLSQSPDSSTLTNQSVTVVSDTYGTGSSIVVAKWAEGAHDAGYFAGAGTDFTGDSFQASKNDTYTVYAKDQGGNEAVQTISISNLITDKPAVALDYSPKANTNGQVEVSVTASVYAASKGNTLTALRWWRGSRSTADFGGGTEGTDIMGNSAFSVTADGTYTVYAKDLAGNETVETIPVLNIITAEPVIALDYSPKSITNASVTVTVASSVYGASTGNELAALRWMAGSDTAADFAGGTKGTDILGRSSFTAAENGTYTVYAKDLVGNEAVDKVDISNIVTTPPQLTLDYSPKSATHGSVTVTVASSVYGASTGNALAALRWMEGSKRAADFAGGTKGWDIQGSPSFAATANGTYTVYAKDQAGNEAVKEIVVENISKDNAASNSSSSSPNPQDACQVAQGCNVLQAGNGGKIAIQGMTISIPPGATKQLMKLTLENVTDEDQSLVGESQIRLSPIFQALKTDSDNFLKPVTLQIAFSAQDVPEGKHARIYYYSEALSKWVGIGGTVHGTIISAQVNHFTRFAVFAADDKRTDPIHFTDTQGHWAAAQIQLAVQAGLIQGYPDGSFRPDGSITRAEFAGILSKVMRDLSLEQPIHPAVRSNFADQERIPQWAEQAMNQMVQEGIIQGFPDRTLRPQAPITRSQMAVMAVKALRLSADFNQQRTPFSDDKEIPIWAKPYVEEAVKAGLLHGTASHRFAPEQLATRAEATVFLLNMLHAQKQ